MTDDLTDEERAWHDPKACSKMMRDIFRAWNESEDGKRERERWATDTRNPDRCKG